MFNCVEDGMKLKLQEDWEGHVRRTRRTGSQAGKKLV